MRLWPLLALSVMGCDRAPQAAIPDSAGGRLEATAVSTGLVPDANASIIGSWARDTDRLCVVPGSSGSDRIGALIDYGEGQGCAASGTVRRSGGTLHVAFGDCKFDAKFDGQSITFPPDLPAACEHSCTGRAELAALSVERLSRSISEAATLSTPAGRILCGS